MFGPCQVSDPCIPIYVPGFYLTLLSARVKLSAFATLTQLRTVLRHECFAVSLSSAAGFHRCRNAVGVQPSLLGGRNAGGYPHVARLLLIPPRELPKSNRCV